MPLLMEKENKDLIRRNGMADTKGSRGGAREGIAKSVSQACVYGIEAKKTILQVSGSASAKVPFHRLIQGMVTSSLTSGLVFGTYFTVYNPMQEHMLAGTAAALATSVIKVPISNGMRVMQSGRARNLVDASRKIVRAHKVRGLYSGYRVSLVEDIVEFDLRARLYRVLRQADPLPGLPIATKGCLWGCVAGAVTSAITTPFDCIKSHIAQEAAKPMRDTRALKIAHNIFHQHGVPGFFRGADYRIASNMVKSALFFTVYELLP
jgi:hypothetical protein